MKRILIILGVCCLMFDLADDGSIGRIPFVAPQDSYYSAAAQGQADDHPSQAVSDTSTMAALLTTHSVGLFGKFYSRRGAGEVPQPRQIIYSRQLSSCGGIPG